MTDVQTHLHEFKMMMEVAHSRTEQQIKEATLRMDGANDAHHKFATELTLRTHEFLQTGIATPVGIGWAGWVHWGERSSFTSYKYFKRVARDAKRPFVYLNGNILTIEKRRYTQPLVAPFLLAGNVVTDKWRIHADPQRSTVVFSCPTYWRIHVRSEEDELLKVWREKCATDRVMRRALRLENYFGR
jgi:hypothetical protein